MQRLFFHLVLLLLLLPAEVLSALKGEYNIKDIPAGLRVESNVVIRKLIKEFQVINSEKTVLQYTEAYTIFSKEEQHYGEFELEYNSSFSDVVYFEGYIYDAAGNEIKDLDSDDISDYSDYASYSLYSDHRFRTAALYHNVYPYTVEFRYKVEYKGFLSWPGWYSRAGRHPVQLSRFTVILPAKEELRYWLNSLAANPEITTEGKNKIYKWEVVNQKELDRDAVNNRLKDYAAHVLTAPGDFTMEGYAGSMKTWSDFGKWYYKLSSNRGELSKEAVQEIKKQYNADDNVEERIKKLYRYMQQRTRYVSIQLGIGGWQPFPASTVHEKGYGDCKALSNYMVSILRTAEISAYPVIIYSGGNDRNIEEFSSNQFNHVIVCVPMASDTVWLECTSQTMPYNTIGYSNENRMALLIHPDGGKIVYTPVSNAVINAQIRKSEVKFSKTGTATSEMAVIWKGNQRDYNYSRIVSAPLKDRIARLSGTMNIPDFIITDYIIEDEKNISSELKLSLKADLPKYATVSGSRIFFKPNLTERITSLPGKNTKRISPVNYDYPFRDEDTVIYYIPAGYIIEALPPEVTLETDFGKYTARCEAVENRIIYTRFFEISSYEIPAVQYPEYRDFIFNIVKADRTQVVLTKGK